MTTAVMTERHVPVLLKEVLLALAVRPGGLYIDCTVGGGGHAEAILDASAPHGRLLAIDADPGALAAAADRLRDYRGRLTLVEANFRDVALVVRERGFAPVDGILFDLGLSSIQLDHGERGFSFQREGPLDMRFSPQGTVTASDIVNGYREQELADMLWRFGEERHSRRIARAVVAARPIYTTTQLARVVEQVVGRGGRGVIHPATRTFQALRIAVNQELVSLATALSQAHGLLDSGARLAVISYHSLEDRIVKDFIRRESSDCVCPPGVPVCVCGHVASLRPIGRSATNPSPAEVAANPRARSARLRVAERLPMEPGSFARSGGSGSGIGGSLA